MSSFNQPSHANPSDLLFDRYKAAAEAHQAARVQQAELNAGLVTTGAQRVVIDHLVRVTANDLDQARAAYMC
jgi:hypothetical protein